jgi:hypothetical protein
MIDVSVRTRSGCSIATVWAIIPPIERPTTCADRRPSASSSATVSAAMSESVYAADDVSPASAAPTSAGGASCRWVDSPMSRLSKRMTYSPRAARPAQSPSGQPIICVPSPWTSRTGGSPGEPNVS